MSGTPKLETDEQWVDELQWVEELGQLLGQGGSLGFKNQSIGGEYAGEFDVSGWRVGDEPEKGSKKHAVWEILASTGLTNVTERWDQDQRDQHRMEVNEDGEMEIEGDIDSMDSYVMDPKTGEIYLFCGTTQTTRVLTPDEIGNLQEQKRAIEKLEEDFRQELAGNGIGETELKGFEERLELRLKLGELAEKQASEKKLGQEFVKDLQDFREGKSNDRYAKEGALEKRIQTSKSDLDLLALDIRQLKEKVDRWDRDLTDVEGEIDATETVATVKYMEESIARIQKVVEDATRTSKTHHSSPLEGANVGGAGTLKKNDYDEITEISNVSGHYKPKYVHLAQTIEQLMRMGALLDQTTKYVDAEGKIEDLNELNNPKLFELWQRITEQLPELEETKREIDDIQKRLDTPPQDMDEQALQQLTEELDEQLENRQEKIKQIQKGMQILNKMGVGAANKASDAKVEFLEGIEGKKGKEIHAMKGQGANLPGVEEFLKTGGGHKTFDSDKREYTQTTVAEAKASLLDELKKETTETRESRDKDADQRREKVFDRLKEKLSQKAFKAFLKKTKAPTAEDIEHLLKELTDDDYDKDALQSRLQELNANDLLDAFLAMGLNEENYDLLHEDKWRRKVVMREMQYPEALEALEALWE